MVKEGIPGAASKKLTREDVKKLEERVKFANVACSNLRSAKSRFSAFSNRILSNEDAVTLLTGTFGFQPDDQNMGKYFRPGGIQAKEGSFTVESIRRLVRESQNWNANGVRINKRNQAAYFSLRLWGATSSSKLPKYTASTAVAKETSSPAPNNKDTVVEENSARGASSSDQMVPPSSSSSPSRNDRAMEIKLLT